MRYTLLLGLVVLFFSFAAAADDLPSCNRQAFSRSGNRVRISTDALTKLINDRVNAGHSHFKNLHVTSAGHGKLNVAAEKDGTPISIQGPAKVTPDGQVSIHADKITRNGSGVKTMMDIFGKDLGDYVNVKNVRSISVHGNDLRINPDSLLGVSGRPQQVRVLPSAVEIMFSSPPCR